MLSTLADFYSIISYLYTWTPIDNETYILHDLTPLTEASKHERDQ